MADNYTSEASKLSTIFNKAILALRKNLNFSITILHTQFVASHNHVILCADLRFPNGLMREFGITFDNNSLIDLPTGLVLKHGWDKYANISYKSKEEANVIRLAFWLYAYAIEYHLEAKNENI